MKNRTSGILCPVFSLPGDFGIGQLGKSARTFIDYLHESGFSHWQILPLNPVDFVNSPYSSSSAFAGYLGFIDFEELLDWNILHNDEFALLKKHTKLKRVDYKEVEKNQLQLLKIAFKNFLSRADKSLLKSYQTFIKSQSHWLPAFALFSSLKKSFKDKSWNQWPKEFRDYKNISAEIWKKFKVEIDFEQFVQFIFYKQWMAIKDYANKKSISIIGDMPIYVNFDSSDVWSHPELFKLNRNFSPREVAGVPPDFFSEDGQLWGFPIYNWSVHKKSQFQWWKERTSHMLQLFDQVRFDHFRAVEAYWSVPAKDETAKNGKWVKAPGADLLDVLCTIKKDGLLAENLGDISDEVEKLRLDHHIPGMKIFQFAFGGHIHSEHLPHNCEAYDIYYSGTHDNDVLKSWFDHLPEAQISHLSAYYGVPKKQLSVRWLVDRILSSAVKTVMIPIQDFLESGAESRINVPGTASDLNWTWRFQLKDMEKINSRDMAYRLDFFGRKRID